MVQVVDEMRAKGIVKPIVASLAGDVEVEEAAQYLYEHGIPAYAYSTEIRSRCSAPSTSGRGVQDCCDVRSPGSTGRAR
jgi:hypothetical protein